MKVFISKSILRNVRNIHGKYFIILIAYMWGTWNVWYWYKNQFHLSLSKCWSMHTYRDIVY